ncbi:vWA domain-containing protein [Aquirufa sp. HETE-83D]|uniref:VWA domain-containing protein n=1 Tax=Aquirufa esocilacus TaxID=3096513 RepID=A0ABW6DIG2_9BACT
MKKATTFYHIILDQSGSMSDCINQTLNGLANQRKEILAIANEFPDREIRVGLTVFDHLVELKYRNLSVTELSQMNSFEYQPNGLTALLDAIGMSVSDTERLMVNEDDAAVMVILTDGHENASKEYSHEQIKNLIQAKEATGNWSFTYLGATLDAVEIAKSMNFKAENSFAFEKKNMDKEAFGRSTMALKNIMMKF